MPREKLRQRKSFGPGCGADVLGVCRRMITGWQLKMGTLQKSRFVTGGIKKLKMTSSSKIVLELTRMLDLERKNRIQRKSVIITTHAHEDCVHYHLHHRHQQHHHQQHKRQQEKLL